MGLRADRADRLVDSFAVPEWFDKDAAIDYSDIFPEINGSLIFSAAGAIGIAERQGKLPSDISDIFEFGSGPGEGLAALDMLAANRQASVVGSEILDGPWYTAQSMASMLLPNVTSVEGNGYEVMDERPEGFDLIVANMFGPVYSGKAGHQRRIEMFVPKALSALKAESLIVMGSDEETMGNVNGWVQDNLDPGQVTIVEAGTVPGFIAVTHTLITK